MSDRSVVVRLQADASQFLAVMAQAQKAAESVGTSAEQGAKKADAAFTRMAKNVQKNSQHIDRLGTTALVAGGAIAAGLGVGVKAFADFDEAMSSVNAALPEAANQMDRLRQLAIDLGKESQFSSTEAAQGITELAKAGVDANAILGGGLKGALDLAAAGQLDVARAAEVSATALKQFNLEGADLGHVADLYAAAAGKAQGSVEDIAQAMKFAGVTANGLGIDIEETVGTLGLFAEQGIIGEQAGTSLRSMLLSLSSPSKIAAKTMDELGISVYDAQGSFVGVGGAAEELKNKLGPLDEATRNAALGQIFGNESINAARALYEGGAREVARWTGAVDDSGFAAEQAAAKTDNLRGDVERLGGELDAVFVQNGEGVNGALRGMVQNLEGAVRSFGELPPAAQQTTLAVAGLTGAGLLVTGMFAKGVTAAADFHESLTKIRDTSPRAAKGIDAATKAAKGLALAATVLAAGGVLDEIFGPKGRDTGPEGLTADLLAADNVVGTFSRHMREYADESSNWWSSNNVTNYADALHDVFDPTLYQRIDKASGSLISFFGFDDNSDIANATDSLTDLDRVLTGLASSGSTAEATRLFNDFAAVAAGQGVSVERLKKLLPGYTEELARMSNEQKLAGGSSADVSDGLTKVERAAADAKEEVEDLASQIRGFGSTALAADEAESRFRDAVDDTAKAVKDNAEAVKDGEKTKAEARRDNRDSLRDLAEATLENSAATFELTGSAEDARGKIESGREAFIKAAGQMDINKEKANELADRYGLIPGNVTTEVEVKGATTARTAVQELIDTIKRLNDKTVKIRYVVSGRLPNGGVNLQGGQVANADGGMLVGGSHGLVKAYADGGVHSIGRAQPQIAKAGGAGILWAEEGAGPWEAFISGHPNKRPRSRVIAEDTVARLGGRVEWRRFADGGMFGAGSTTFNETRQVPVFVTGPVSVGTLGEVGDRAEAELWRKSMGQQI